MLLMSLPYLKQSIVYPQATEVPGSKPATSRRELLLRRLGSIAGLVSRGEAGSLEFRMSAKASVQS